MVNASTKLSWAKLKTDNTNVTVPAVLGTYLCHHVNRQGKWHLYISSSSEITAAIRSQMSTLTLR